MGGGGEYVGGRVPGPVQKHKNEQTKNPQNRYSPGPLSANNTFNSLVMNAFVLSQ